MLLCRRRDLTARHLRLEMHAGRGLHRFSVRAGHAHELLAAPEYAITGAAPTVGVSGPRSTSEDNAPAGGIWSITPRTRMSGAPYATTGTGMTPYGF